MIKRVIIVLILYFSIFIEITNAHPLDISVSTLSIKGNVANFTTYFHSFEIEYLLRENNINPDGVLDYYKNEDIIKTYIKNNITFKNNNKICNFDKFEIIEDEAYKILSDGLSINYKIICIDNIKKFILNINYFTNFPLQTNRITIFDINNGIKGIRPILYKVLTSKVNEFNLDLNNLEGIKHLDTDNDGLSNEYEKIYNTDPNNIDTDGDNYTDKEEVEYGWNPLNKELGPYQDYREKLDISISNKKINELSKINSELKYYNLSDYGYGNNYLKSVMKYINNFFSKNEGNLLYVFFIIFGLGVIHAIGPGHSKSLIIGYTIEKNISIAKGILFAFIFTITHILDIIILFVITKILIIFIDPSKYTYFIQLLSAIILFILGIYLVYSSIKYKNNCKNTKKTLLVAFIAGLAPCSFAWSIFLLLIALGKTAWIIPLIFALGLGIFTTLSLIVVFTNFLKNKIYSKLEYLARYSSMFSAAIILIISIIIFYKLI